MLFLVKKVKAFFAAAGDFFKVLFEKIPQFISKPGGGGFGFLGKIPGFLREKIQRLPEIFHDKRRRLFMLLGAGCAVLLVLAVVLMFSDADEKPAVMTSAERRGTNPGQTRTETVRRGSTLQGVIPPEEIFLPDEPDFLPGVLAEREQRSSWTGADAAPYWHDPLKYGEENWRERVEAVIDQFLENIP